MIGDGYTMGVTAQITEHMIRASERWFRVDHPVLSKQWPEPCSKVFRLSKGLQVSVEAELAILKGALKCRDELAAKNAAEHLDGKKESVAWFDPTRAIGRESAGRHHAMHMWVKSLSVESEARGGKACTERGVFARFRFNDLKEAARRRTRALWKLNGAKGRRRGASGLCGGAQQMIRRARKLAIAEKCCEESV